MANSSASFRKISGELMASLLLLGATQSASPQINLNKIDKTVRDATNLLHTTAAFVNAANRTSAEFSRTVKVMKGNGADETGSISQGEMTKPKIKKGEFTNLKWEPVTYFDGNYFHPPSSAWQLIKER